MPAEAYSGLAPVKGFLEGYQTMDTIAALNFGIIIADQYQGGGSRGQGCGGNVHSTERIDSGALLASVYCALTYVGIKAGPGGPDPGQWSQGSDLCGGADFRFSRNGGAGPDFLYCLL